MPSKNYLQCKELKISLTTKKVVNTCMSQPMTFYKLARCTKFVKQYFHSRIKKADKFYFFRLKQPFKPEKHQIIP